MSVCNRISRFETLSVIIITSSVIIIILMTVRVSKRWDPRDMTLRRCVIGPQRSEARSIIIIITCVIIIILMTVCASKRWDPRDTTLCQCVIGPQRFEARSITIIIIIIIMTRHGLRSMFRCPGSSRRDTKYFHVYSKAFGLLTKHYLCVLWNTRGLLRFQHHNSLGRR